MLKVYRICDTYYGGAAARRNFVLGIVESAQTLRAVAIRPAPMLDAADCPPATVAFRADVARVLRTIDRRHRRTLHFNSSTLNASLLMRMRDALGLLFCILTASPASAADPLLAGGCFDRQALIDRVVAGSLLQLVTLDGITLHDEADFLPRRHVVVSFKEGNERVFALLRADTTQDKPPSKLCVWMLADSGGGSMENPFPSHPAAKLWFPTPDRKRALQRCNDMRPTIKKIRGQQLIEGIGGEVMSFDDDLDRSQRTQKHLACGPGMERSSTRACQEVVADRKASDAKDAREAALASKEGDRWCDSLSGVAARMTADGMKLYTLLMTKELAYVGAPRVKTQNQTLAIFVPSGPPDPTVASSGWEMYVGDASGYAFRLGWGKTYDALKINDAVFPRR